MHGGAVGPSQWGVVWGIGTKTKQEGGGGIRNNDLNQSDAQTVPRLNSKTPTAIKNQR